MRRHILAALATVVLGSGLVACSGTWTGSDGTCTTVDAQSTPVSAHIQPCSTPTPPTSSTTPPQTTTTREDPPPTSATTSEPSQPPSTTTPGATTTQPPAAGFPNADTTGYAPGTALTTLANSGQDYYTQGPGTTIENAHIVGTLWIDDDNVTIRNSWIEGIVRQSNNNYHYVLDHVTVGPESGCNGDAAIGERNYTLSHVKVQHFGDAFRSTDKIDATTAGVSNITIKDSLAQLCANPGDHGDGFQGYYGGSGVLIEHNTIDQGQASHDQPTGVTAPVFNSDYSKGLVLKDNLLIGGSFTIRLGSDGKNTAESRSTATGNLVVKDAWVYGPVASDCAQIDWSGNRLVTLNPGTYDPVDAGTELACTS